MSVPKIELPLPSERGGGLSLPQPYLLFLGDTTEAGYAKTAFGLADWAADRCVGEWGIGGCTVTTGLPRLSPAEARAAGARSLVIGVANQGALSATAGSRCSSRRWRRGSTS